MSATLNGHAGITSESSTSNGGGRIAAETKAFRNEPLLDFARAEVRDRMKRALAEVRAQFGVQVPVVVAGREEKPAGAPVDGAEWIRSVNPSNPSETVGWSAAGTAAQATAAIDAAAKAFPAWSRVSVEERCAALERAADHMAARRYEYNAWIVFEAGKPWREADGDVAEAIDFLRYYAAHMRELATPRATQELPGETNEYEYRSLGPGIVIAPWNFPMAILCGMAAAALVAGNTVVMKPAEQTPVSAWLVYKSLQEGGRLPAGVLNFMPGLGEVVGETIVTDARTAFVVFTGSVSVGLHIHATAAKVNPAKHHVTRVIAEMGGKNAIIVDESADLDAAVAGVTKSAFYYAGQKCSACSRVLVVESAYDAFLRRLRESAASLKVGPAEDPATQVGPVIDADSVARVESFGGKKVEALATDPDSQFMAPTIVEVTSENERVMQEEIFGPVLAVMKIRDFDEGLRIANSTRFALTGGLYSRTPSHVERARREMECGNLYINRSITGAIVERQPFGGFKLSGIGSKAGGPDYLKQFLVPKTFTENTLRHGYAPVGDV